MIPSPSTYFTAAEARQTGAEPVWIITLGDDYEIPQSDILDAGEMSVVRPYDFSDLASGSYTCILDNSSGRYSPRRAEFIFPERIWYRQEIKIELAYRRPGWQELRDRITLFEGLVLDWQVTEAKDFDSRAPYPGLVAVLTCQDHLFLLQERRVGTPADDGELQPLVYGTVVKDALPLQDTILWTPDTTCDAEEGDTSDFDSVTTAGAGTFAASTTEAYAGSYSYKAVLTNNAADEAYATVNLSGAAVTNVLISAMVKFTSIPGAFPNRVPFIMGFRNSALTEQINLGCSVAGILQLYVAGPGVVDCDLDINDLADRWVRLSIGADLAVPGTVRVYLDGNVIGEAAYNYAFAIQYAFFGFHKAAAVATIWEAYFDDIKVTENYYPLGYYLPSAPYTSINSSYRDGVIIPEQAPKHWYYRQNRAGFAQGWVKAVYGRYVSNALYSKSALYGFVAFADLSDQPSGTIFIEATKNATTHPVDINEGILTEVGLDDRIDAANFAAAKAVLPDDVLGCWFDEAAASQALAAVNEKALLDLVENQGEIKLLPYTGAPPAVSVLTLSRSNCFAMEQASDMTALQTVANAKYGWYEKNPLLYYRAQDSDMIAVVGEQPRELDFSYGQAVMSGDADMAAAKADLLLTRMKGPREIFTCSGFLDLARVEIGDGVTVSNSQFNDIDLVYEVFGKVVNCTAKTVTLTVVRFLGEES